MSDRPRARAAASYSPVTVGSEAAIVIRQARWKGALLFSLSLPMSLSGAWIARQPGGAVIGWLNAAFFGLCAAAAGAQVVRRGRLTLSPAGLRLEHLGRQHAWAWSQLSGFRVWRIRRTQIVTFDDSLARPGPLARLGLDYGAGAVSLPPSWALRPAELAQLLEDCRARWS